MGLRGIGIVGTLMAASVISEAGQGNSQIKGTKFIPGSSVVVPVRAGDKEAKTALDNFTDFLRGIKKDHGSLIILELPEITTKNLPAAEAAFKALTDPNNGMKPGGTNIGGDFTSQEKVRASFFVKNFGRRIATIQDALETDEGSVKATQTRKTADSYNVKGDSGIVLAIGTQVPLSALQPTEKSSK